MVPFSHFLSNPGHWVSQPEVSTMSQTTKILCLPVQVDGCDLMFGPLPSLIAGSFFFQVATKHWTSGICRASLGLLYPGWHLTCNAKGLKSLPNATPTCELPYPFHLSFDGNLFSRHFSNNGLWPWDVPTLYCLSGPWTSATFRKSASSAALHFSAATSWAWNGSHSTA